ncbi:MAG: hemolysin III family protein [Pseudomonadales bacterium]|nr:hemolysin III family protein [Pseudomonadales bacterium]
MYEGEKLNSITHLVGAVLAVMGFGALLTIGIQEKDVWLLASFIVFGTTLVLLYTMSTLYHSFHPPELKKLFQKLDHVAIYLLIAGTYTPYMLVSMREGSGLVVLALIWSLAIIGLLLDILIPKRIKWLQILIYLVMGWLCTFNLAELKAAVPEPAMYWLTVGGLAYTGGVIFYVLDGMKKLTHAHGIWHLFVLFGSVCHFASIAGYIR